MIEPLNTTPVSVSQIWTHTARDPILMIVKQFLMTGWTATDNLPPEFQLFVKHKYELSIQDNYLLWGSRVVVSLQLQDRVLQQPLRHIQDYLP